MVQFGAVGVTVVVMVRILLVLLWLRGDISAVWDFAYRPISAISGSHASQKSEEEKNYISGHNAIFKVFKVAADRFVPASVK